MEDKGSIDVLEPTPSQTQSTLTLDVVNKEGRDYEPFEHRDVVHPTSTWGAFFHLLKSSLGSGLLAMPAAFKHTGLIPGCIGTLLVGIIATHCVHILVTTSRNTCKETRVPSLNYTETCEAVFKNGPKILRPYSKLVRYFADYAMAGVCIGGTSVYVIFIASSLKDICDPLLPSQYDIKIYCCMLILPLSLISQMRYLKFLVPFSIIANVCLVITFGITCYYAFRGTSTGEVKWITSPTRWPLFLSTSIFAIEGINVVMPVENEMSKPGHFLGCPGVLNLTMTFVVVFYGLVGVFGYLKYGDQVLGSITLNLPQGEPLALAAKILVAMAVFFTYCLQMYAPLAIIWMRIRHRFGGKWQDIGQVLVRTSVVVFTVILTAVVPDLESLIGLVGAICFSTLGLLIPLIVETVHRWERNFTVWLLVKNGLLLMFYVTVLVSGCYSAISQIVQKSTLL